MSLVYIYTFVDLPLFKLQTKSWMRTTVCGFNCHWRYWHYWARGFCCCSVVSVFLCVFFSRIFWDFPERFCAWSWARWCTQMQSMAYCSDTYTHLLIDYKEHADVSFTDSLGQTGTSNMAHHHSFLCSVGGLYHTVSVSPYRRHSGSIPPPLAWSIYCSFRLFVRAPNLHPARYILYSYQYNFSYSWIFSSANAPAIDHCCLMLCIW